MEEQTNAVGTRIITGVVTNGGGAKGRKTGRGTGKARKTVHADSTKIRKRTVKQYQWSTAGRDAFNVAQTPKSICTKANRSDSSDTRFERGEGGGVT